MNEVPQMNLSIPQEMITVPSNPQNWLTHVAKLEITSTMLSGALIWARGQIYKPIKQFYQEGRISEITDKPISTWEEFCREFLHKDKSYVNAAIRVYETYSNPAHNTLKRIESTALIEIMNIKDVEKRQKIIDCTIIQDLSRREVRELKAKLKREGQPSFEIKPAKPKKYSVVKKKMKDIEDSGQIEFMVEGRLMSIGFYWNEEADEMRMKVNLPSTLDPISMMEALSVNPAKIKFRKS